MTHRLVLGHQRTRLRREMAPYLAMRNPRRLAKALNLRIHTARYLIAGKLRAGLHCAEGIARAQGVTVADLLR